MTALIFDLDGTLVDTVYAHVFAWQRGLAEAGMPVDGWRIHRRMGMSGGLFARAVAREVATSGRRPEIEASLEALRIGPETTVVERGDVLRAEPEPDLFVECARRLGVAPDDCYVVGDAVWDLLAARRAEMLCRFAGLTFVVETTAIDEGAIDVPPGTGGRDVIDAKPAMAHIGASLREGESPC